MPDDEPYDDPAEWDWDAIRAEERKVAAKAERLPHCWVCGATMWCGQRDRHYLCSPPPPPVPYTLT